MKQGNRKHIRLLAMAMSLAVVGMLAAFMALAAQPAPASAQDPCDGPLAPILPQCQGSTPTPTPPTGPDTTPDAGDMITSDSTSGGAAPEFQVVIGSLPMNLAVGGSIVLYLEDDYQEPATIPASSVYFVASPPSPQTGNGARVYTIIAPNINTDAYFDADKSDISIRVFIPDMCTNATDACEGANGPMQGQKLTMVVEDNSGIKNPTEAGSHSAAFAILDPTDGVPGPAAVDKDFELPTWAKISLSDVDNIRDYELTITGSGFNDGTTAAVYVLHDPSVGSVAFDNSANEAALCERIVNRGTLAGGSLVGSDDRVSVTFVVTAPTFGPGNTNYICMVDGEGRMSHTDVERFHLEHSIRVSPSTVSAGDTATVFAQDYPNAGASFSSLRIAGSAYAPDGTSLSAFITSHSAIGPDGDATLTFEVPDGREGTLRLDARWGNIEASTRITVREGGFTEPQFVGPVSSLAASADGQEAGAVRLIWSPAENAQVHFVIYVKSEELYAGNYASARMAPFSGSEGVITGLDGGTTYHFNVIGMRWNWVDYGAVWGGWTDWASATPVGADATSDVEPPLTEPQFVGRVANLTASADGQEAGAVRATWSEADNAQVHFVIYVKSEELYANNYASTQMAPFAGSEGLITGLDGGTSYHFNVIGMRWNWVQYGAVWGGWAEWAPATPGKTDATTEFNEGSSAVRTVAENTVRGQDIGDPVDATGDDLEYILTGDDASSFSIVSGTGQLQTRAALDHETKAAYAAVIIAFNPSGGSATISVTIHVDNVEEPGTVTLSSGRFTVGETIVATLTDPDGSIAETRWLWEKSLDKIAWTAIGGATSAEYTPVLEDVGHYLRVTGSYSDGEGPSKAASGISDEPVPPVQAPRDDRAVLTTLYRATDGANWANNTNWLSDLSLDQWHGVIADDDGRVTFIFLNRNRLLGRVPSELGRLSNLRSLSLQHNLLVGEIPSTIGNLPDLQGLYLGGNLMTGELPTALGDLTNLANLDVSGNQLAGELPTALGDLTNLANLDVSGNQLAGELPTALGKLTNLKNLDVSGNQLAGVIPTWLGNLTTLTLLDLDYNQFTGHIPEELGNLTKLEYLELDENNLEGEIPESLASLSNLERLELSGNSFTGCIPAALRDVPENDLLELGLPFCDGSQPYAEKTIDFASLRNAGYLEHNMPQAAAAIKALLWVADSITLSEKDAVERLVYIAVFYPDVFNVLIRLPWIVDSMTEAETSVVDSLGSIASYDEAAAERIIQMPFLEAIDPPDVHAMRSLWIFAFVDEAGFQQILSHFTLNGGIDDHDAKIVALLHSSPSLRSVLLDPDRVEDIEVEDRIIQLQLSGDVVLAIIRPQPGNAGSMDLLANAVQSAQAFIGEPFPVNYVALLFGEDVIPGFAGTNFGTHIAVLPQFDADDGSHGARTAGLLIAHEVAHYYWRGNQGWIDEGASEFVASVAENARTGEPIEADQGPCAYARNIAALERLDTSRNEEAYGCNYSLGERIFLDLHRTLAHGEFRQGFRRLYLTSEMEADPDDPGRTRSDIERVRNAFPPKASAVIARWYDGTEPYDLSNLDVRPVDPSLPVINGRIEEAYITLGPEGPAVSTLSPERKADHVYLHLEYSYRVSGGHYDVPLEIVQYYEDGFTFGRRTVTITAEEGYIGGGLRLGVGAPPGEPWASGRYWVYVYDRDRKVAEVQYEVTP